MIATRIRRFCKKQRDLFTLTQSQLTIRYSMLIMIFLALFIGAVYLLLNVAVSFEQERELQKITDQEVELIEAAIKTHSISELQIEDLNLIRDNSNQFFYYLVDTEGQVLYGDEYIHRVQREILERVKGWLPQPGEFRYETLMPVPPPAGKKLPPGFHTIRLLITGKTLTKGDQVVGIFYSGRDIGPIYEFMNGILLFLIGLGVLFWGISFLFSYFMSKRAIAPIRESFLRQREFVDNASHELRTPLAILKSSLDVFEIEEEDRLTGVSKKVMAHMKDEVRRMTRLIGDLLTLARSDSEQQSLKVESFDVVPVICDIQEALEVLAKEKAIELTVKMPTSIQIDGDRERLKQLFYILLDNALKYTPEGGRVTMVASVQTKEKKQWSVFRVQDTGVGIANEEQARIFDRFYRVNKNRSRQMGGTGLGLSIAKWIVEAHQGEIKVTSELQKGTTFVIMLPTRLER
ncbi:sensor histidine kinase [Brevibacillus fluminis]|uniref:histidine kinase n=1 Tax=Brevibacillus fluminis TaxID=511487 RepID=A0A3M8DRW4_9BACL|nr:ATP-binding protein [Brevibacillus fluminis]RNB90634.1 sensor histidine kinase [Brevibacillus fluminis]